ncbi:MAG: hypothetical protein AAGH15_18225, partial [Myxococcota bacterium]
AEVVQDLVPGYPIRELALDARVRTTAKAIVLEELTLTNAAAATRLEATGTYEQLLPPGVDAGGLFAERIPGREALTAEGELTQGLAVLVPLGVAERASGTLGVPFRVESGNLVTFRTDAQLAPSDVDLAIDGMEVRGLDGLVPIREYVTLLQDGRLAIEAGPGGNVLVQTRFPDVQPFLDTQDFVSARQIVVGEDVIGPLAGNLRIDGLSFELDRLQVGWRGGVIDGRLEADVTPGRSQMAFRGNVTGLRPEAEEDDDVLDANLALTLVPEDYALDGTVQVLRVGRTHLLQLLDALDPYREDPDMNSLRTALRFGYPESVRLRAREGLLDVRVRLGGVARLVRIGDILGVPLTPLLEPELEPLVAMLGELVQLTDAPPADAARTDAEPETEEETP